MPVDPSKMTKTERQNFMYGVDALRMIEHDIHDRLWDLRGCPPDWHDIWRDDDRRDPKRERVTLRLDSDVLKFFRAMGPGYQPRINRVLRAFMHMRLAKVIEGPDVNDYVLRPEQLAFKTRRRVEFGESGEEG
ncbi:BrnA antitoxin family protein [Oceanicola sp. 502str15]|uniref:BrnA antitoxin family protein n=1 Tax=Rhodobacterales TaxID=204455 RepID=UPI00209496D6|nr:BrnA antitoxin family protein [Oceanicola sp. 502str15]MCO6381097.1 hypothetical protein [Oceanicola sp. 502str15]